MAVHAERATGKAASEAIRDVKRTTCCVVGGGPGGAVLALLLARSGVGVTLLEAHPDFDSEFRGDTLHPSVMEIMDQLGLAERLLELRHSELRDFTLQTVSGPFTPVDLGRLKTKFPYITMMPQTSFLEFVTREAKRYPNFRLVMGARVRELVEDSYALVVAGLPRSVRLRLGMRIWSRHENRVSWHRRGDNDASPWVPLPGM
jgi:2-polyprenyl-6-methoxyphenol hydroxylase-like FAD-dependent oxidoreductase